MKGVSKDVVQYLNDFQFGVRVSGGAEAILHSANMVLSKRHGDGSLTMLTIDFTNTFYLLDLSTILWEVRMRSHLFPRGLSFYMVRHQCYTLGMCILCQPLECNKVTHTGCSFFPLCYIDILSD